jgi:hypothetical protein
VDASHRLYPEWRGGYYYAARPKGDPANPLGLLYVSRWSSAPKAAEFAAIYAQSLPKRYKHVHEVGINPDQPGMKLETLQSLTGKHEWLTEDGTIKIDVQGDIVFVTESLDEPTSDLLEQDLFKQVK